MTRRGLVAVVLATLLLGILLLFVAHASAGSPAAPASSIASGVTVTVQPGDTLWSIAQRAEPNRDPRLVVDQLRKVNHLDSVALTPGQTLKVG
ncbi:MAG: LysM peptidoglycan-binding domain-containing protein [Actinomycetota bacterium]|nr:LysM peptidoglycan-binding domain-containing protein [Actinomycetota bacterium]